MKKISVALVSIVLSQSVAAQSIQDIKSLISKGDARSAKNAIDLYMTDTKNQGKAESWYYKGSIYNEYAKSPVWGPPCTNCRWQAFEAFKTCLKLDDKYPEMILEQYVRLFDIYNGFFDQGSVFFGDKKYAEAYSQFNSSLQVQQFIYQKKYSYNGFSFSALDTSLVTNLALAARLAGNIPASLMEYRKLIQAGLNGPAHQEMYIFVADEYAKMKDQANLDWVLEKARKLYPENEYWDEVELEIAKGAGEFRLFAKYDELLKKFPQRYVIHYNYAAELYNSLYVKNTKFTDREKYQTRLEDVIESAIQLNKTIAGYLLAARSFYNRSYEQQIVLNKLRSDQKTNTPIYNIEKKKLDDWLIKALKNALAAEEVFNTSASMKNTNKANYKDVLSIIAELYSAIGEAEKSALYKARLAAL